MRAGAVAAVTDTPAASGASRSKKPMRVTCIPAWNPGHYTGAGNNTYLLDGREPTLVDAGTGELRHLDAVAEALAGRPLARVLVTHAHSDHASGAPAIAARWPGVRFFKRPWPDRDARYAVPWQPIDDGDLVPAGDGTLRVLHTPGHAPDHLAFFDEASRVLFAGDLLVADSTVVIPASHGGDLVAYLASLERVRALAPTRVLPAHGPPIDDAAALVDRYLAHRRERERQVLAVLRELGTLTVDVLIARIYPDLAPELQTAARETLLAHLAKLEAEGRLLRDGDEWRVRASA